MNHESMPHFKSQFLLHTIFIITAEMWVQIFFNNPVYITLAAKILIVMLILIIVFLIIKGAVIEDYTKLIKDHPPKQILSALIVPSLIGIVVGVAIIPSLIPIFEITSPKDNSLVGQLITVRGHGAIPGSEIKVFVIDGSGGRWLQGVTFSDMNGNWDLYPVNIGKTDDGGKGKMYVIYTLMNTTEGAIYASKEIRVGRE